MAGGPFQGEAGAAAPGPIQQPPMAAPAAQANSAAGSGVEPMMEDALNDLLVFPDISDSIQKEFTIDGRPSWGDPRNHSPVRLSTVSGLRSSHRARTDIASVSAE
jgi:hypothetical protein